MPRITFIQPGGNPKTVDAPLGDSVMRAATTNGINGIVAECGGSLSCATCHAYVGEEWLAKLPPPTAEEAVMVDCAVDVRSTSRLTCQIVVTQDLDGMVIEVPKTQY
jgi:ferredoxin, 2Fe-2S